jgi:hypothetical protein
MAEKNKGTNRGEGRNEKNRTNNTPSVARNTPNNEPNSETHRSGQHPERLHGPKSGEEARSGTRTDQ